MIMKLLISFGLLVGMIGNASAGLMASWNEPIPSGQDDSMAQLFRVTEGKLIDWAIASSVEPGYFRDFTGGQSYVGAQVPIVFVTPYISCDMGYLTGYDENQRGSLMVGGSIRVNKIIEVNFPDQMKALSDFLPPALDPKRLWVGPFLSHKFTAGDMIVGVKAGWQF